MAYIYYVNLAHQIVSFILQSYTVYYCVNVLFRKGVLKKSVKLSPAITVYFGVAFICSFIGTIHFGYMIIFWRPEGGEYNAYLLYSALLAPGLFYGSSSIAETFLCIERCLSLLFPFKYSHSLKIYFAVLTFFGVIGAMAALSQINGYFKMIPTNSNTPCQYFTCIVSSNKFLFAARLGFNMINIIFALLLAYLIKKRIISSKSAAQMNKTVFVLIISTTIIEILPFISGQIYAIVNDEQLFQYIGPFGTTAVVFNIFLSVKMYYKAFKKFAYQDSSNQTAVTAVTPK